MPKAQEPKTRPIDALFEKCAVAIEWNRFPVFENGIKLTELLDVSRIGYDPAVDVTVISRAVRMRFQEPICVDDFIRYADKKAWPLLPAVRTLGVRKGIVAAKPWDGGEAPAPVEKGTQGATSKDRISLAQAAKEFMGKIQVDENLAPWIDSTVKSRIRRAGRLRFDYQSGGVMSKAKFHAWLKDYCEIIEAKRNTKNRPRF